MIDPQILTRRVASVPTFTDFFDLSPVERVPLLAQATTETHAWHFARNPAYRHTVKSRGVGQSLAPEQWGRVLRTTAHAFKGYIDRLGTTFPNDRPREFAIWLDEQLSIRLDPARQVQLRPRYASLEALLADIERLFADLGLEIVTSSGTSGRATIMVRDRVTTDLAVECYYEAMQRAWTIDRDYKVIFVMPRETRVAMARIARLGTARMGMAGPDQSFFTIPFSADPDRIRVRTGRTFRQGYRGWVERRWLHPFFNYMYATRVRRIFVRKTVRLLRACSRSSQPVLLFGNPVQLHAIAQDLAMRDEVITLPVRSRVGTGGGMKEQYSHTATEIVADLESVLRLQDGSPVPVRDIYGMAEANWATFQCDYRNYHFPPWVYAVALGEDDENIEAPRADGLLAFFDPLGSGRLFPSFFKTTDHVRLVNGGAWYDPALACPCGYNTAYLEAGSIQRVDLIEEAGCAGQI